MRVAEAITRGQWRWNRGDLRLNAEVQLFIRRMEQGMIGEMARNNRMIWIDPRMNLP